MLLRDRVRPVTPTDGVRFLLHHTPIKLFCTLTLLTWFHWKFALVACAVVVVHELCHAAADQALGLGVEYIKFDFAGGSTKAKRTVTALWQGIALQLSAPVASIYLVCFVFAVMDNTHQPPVLAAVAFWIAVLNLWSLVPVLVSDGWKILALALTRVPSKVSLAVMLPIPPILFAITLWLRFHWWWIPAIELGVGTVPLLLYIGGKRPAASAEKASLPPLSRGEVFLTTVVYIFTVFALACAAYVAHKTPAFTWDLL